jgi:hypothetical protein
MARMVVLRALAGITVPYEREASEAKKEMKDAA